MSIKSILLLIVASCSFANAFVILPPQAHFGLVPMTMESATALFSRTKLQYRNQDEDDSPYTNDTNGAAVSVIQRSSQIPPSMFLPRQASEGRLVSQTMDTEIILGRIAMIASVVMISSEVYAGTSLPDQVTNLFHL